MPKTELVGQVARRSYWREADAQVVVGAWRDSGMSLAAFCRRYGLSSGRVSRWAKRLAEPMRFHPVELVTEGSRTGDPRLELELSDGTTVRLPSGFAAEDLSRVLAALDERGRC